MASPEPRVLVPAQAAKGETIVIKTLISHQMETGLRHDAKGNVIPRMIINRFSCRYNDVEVFSADLHEAIAANPYIEFHVRATESGKLDFVWTEDGGLQYSLTHHLVVS